MYGDTRRHGRAQDSNLPTPRVFSHAGTLSVISASFLTTIIVRSVSRRPPAQRAAVCLQPTSCGDLATAAAAAADCRQRPRVPPPAIRSSLFLDNVEMMMRSSESISVLRAAVHLLCASHSVLTRSLDVRCTIFTTIHLSNECRIDPRITGRPPKTSQPFNISSPRDT